MCRLAFPTSVPVHVAESPRLCSAVLSVVSNTKTITTLLNDRRRTVHVSTTSSGAFQFEQSFAETPPEEHGGGGAVVAPTLTVGAADHRDKTQFISLTDRTERLTGMFCDNMWRNSQLPAVDVDDFVQMISLYPPPQKSGHALC
jgi:hypothetical protein